MLSAVSGIARGIQWLSNINMVLALVLAVFVLVNGLNLLILNLFPVCLVTTSATASTCAHRMTPTAMPSSPRSCPYIDGSDVGKLLREKYRAVTPQSPHLT
ncbi:BCCT family transporter [Mycobacterium gallinarum]|uniref:BCCT family transporter n=2 Tax=Mycobacterium TaxID=1763 RepID=UPI003D9C0B3D